MKECSSSENHKQNLCCCEYWSYNEERSHILTCCCNCQEFDEVFTNLVTCSKIDAKVKAAMLLTFQDRLRIPWRGGAKQVTVDALIPIVVIPIILGFSAINGYWALALFSLTSLALAYVLWFVKKRQIRTKFFCMWILCSVIYMTIVFEVAVPLLELLPEENFVLVALSCAAIYCFYRVRSIATLNHIARNDFNATSMSEEEEVAGDNEEKTEESVDAASDQTALLIMDNDTETDSPHTRHCSLCGANIINFDHHSHWLDCCIGELNSRYYMLGLLFADMALLMGSNLTLTAVCHPILIFRFLGIFVMLPDDCSEVFDTYELGISFVIGVYAFLIAIYVWVLLMRQIYFISIGGRIKNRRKSILENWRSFARFKK